MERTEPDMRPLGALALGAAMLSAFLTVTPLFPLAYLPAVMALLLGLMSRSHERSRGLGTSAVVMAVIVVVAVTATFVLLASQ